MKKFFSVLFIIMMSFFLVSCKGGAISKSKAKKDLNEKLNYISIDELEIEKSQRNDKVDNIWVKIDFHNDTCTGERYYELVYNYYDRGGWMLDQILDYKISDWNAAPQKGYKADNENLGYLIFTDYSEMINDKSVFRGYTIDNVYGVRFSDWSKGSTEVCGRQDYIKNVEHTEDLEKLTITDKVTVSASNDLFEITEVINIVWTYNIEYLNWEFSDAFSEDSSFKLKKNLNGLYQDIADAKRATLTINEADATLNFAYENRSKGQSCTIRGLKYAYLDGTDTVYITFFPDKFVYGKLYNFYFKDKIEVPSFEPANTSAKLKFTDYKDNILMTEKDISAIEKDSEGITFRFTSEGAEKFKKATKYISSLFSSERYMMVSLYDTAIFAPSITGTEDTDCCRLSAVGWNVEDIDNLAEMLETSLKQ